MFLMFLEKYKKQIFSEHPTIFLFVFNHCHFIRGKNFKFSMIRRFCYNSAVVIFQKGEEQKSQIKIKRRGKKRERNADKICHCLST